MKSADRIEISANEVPSKAGYWAPLKKIIIVAAKLGYQVRVFADAAARIGYTAQLITDRCHQLSDPWGDSALPLHFDQPDLDSLSGLKADGIIAVGDQPAYIAAQIAQKLGLQFHSVEAVRASTNKLFARECFSRAGLPVPWFRLCKPNDTGIPFPCVLKPLGLSGSRGVIRANGQSEFVAAMQRIRKIQPDRLILAESFIEGQEFAVEGLVHRGQFRVLAIFDKPDPLNGPFFEETLYVTPSRAPQETKKLIENTVTQAVATLGLTHGPIHAELRVNDSGAYMLEVAPRPIGGLCAQVLRFGNGIGLEELLLRHAAGEDVFRMPPVSGAAGVMMIPIPEAGIYKGVTGIEAAKAVPGIEDVIITAKEGYPMVPLPEGSSYLGFIFARENEASQVENSLRLAHSKLQFELMPLLPLL